MNPQYSVTKMNYHLESVFQIVVLLHPHNSRRALGLLAEFKRLEDYAEFKLCSCICKNRQGQSNRIFLIAGENHVRVMGRGNDGSGELGTGWLF